MTNVVHSEFYSPRQFRPRRPSLVRRIVSRYQLIELSVIIGAILLLWGGSSLGRIHNALQHAPSGWLESVRIDIIDGDSIRSGGQVYRLIGFNTPEGGDNARCARERVLADRAAQRLRQLVTGGELDLRRVRCACAPGTEGTGQCNYGRLCATLKVRRRDVGAILIGEGLAEPYNCVASSCPPRRNWCFS
jgi:endonuclease YncB( thermonuclease family)